MKKLSKRRVTMIIQGIPVSNGYAIQKVHKWEGPHYNIFSQRVDSVETEIKRFQHAIASAKADLIDLRNRTLHEIDLEHAKIIDSHLQILEDPETYNLTLEALKANHLCIEKNYLDVTEKFAIQLENVDNEYLKERVADIRDVCTRVLSHLMKTPLSISGEITEEVIVVAHHLPPSIIASLDKRFAKGIVTESGGKTSHSAIMMRSMNIPGVFGVKELYTSVLNNQIMIVDGFLGQIILSPTDDQIDLYTKKRDIWLDSVKITKQSTKKKTQTKDHHHIQLAANILTPEDIKKAQQCGAEGIGLYRTEFLYMKSQLLPTEDEQLEAYKIALQSFPNQKVVIRTLDVGADKEVQSIPFVKELNPFLGYRSTRFLLGEPKLFKTQLRALLRSSVYGQLCILFPMISTIDELKAAKSLLEEAKQELLNENISLNKYEVGMMIEVPAAALMADLFAKEVDFFSIGTNDLIQYTFAADRMNENVSYLYEPCHPAIIRLIRSVVTCAHNENKWVGVCGEIAGDENASIFLLGLGVDELSMSPSRVNHIRERISKSVYENIVSSIPSMMDEETSAKVCKKIKELF